MSDPKIVPPRGGSSTAHADQQARRRELARDVLLAILARDDVNVPHVLANPKAIALGAVGLADELLARLE